VHRAARARLRDGGGVVLAQHGDTLSACFGYPSTERSVERAVLAALALGDIAHSSSEQIDVRIGVDTGVVVRGAPGPTLLQFGWFADHFFVGHRDRQKRE
jgi:class 3 adenylate cyclase